MKVFVTGSTGFVGGHTVDRLAAAGHQLRCLVRRPESAPARLQAPGIELVQGDLGDEEALRAAMAGCDAVVHLASVNTHWEPHPRVYREVNVEGVRKVMTAALDAGVRVALNVGTALSWGKPPHVPFDEDTPRGPDLFSGYAKSKRVGDQVAWRLHAERGLPLVSVYPGGVVGPGNVKQTSQYIHTVLEGKLPGIVFPDIRQTYVHVGDVAEIIARAIETPAAVGRKYLAGNETLSMAELNALLVDLTGVKLPRLRMPGFAMHAISAAATKVADVTKREPVLGMARGSILHMAAGCHFDGSRAERELGITYTPIRESIAAEIAGYESQEKRET
jgi:dihydroflavonol-4-reductase